MTVPVITDDREFAFGVKDFERVRHLIFQRAGIDLNHGKQAMVYSRLSRRLRDCNHASFDSYLRWLENASGAKAEQEWQEFVNCLTTNLTAFFREEHHFTALHDALKQHSQQKRINIWCCAASTGEEPYSLAMVVAESLGLHANVKILATDIDTKVLATASRGIYEGEPKGISPTRLRMFFQKGKGNNEGKARIKPELASMIEFRPFNLMEPNWKLGEMFDIVFCRNVMIYFNAGTQRQVLDKIHQVMVPTGQLYVGHSENFAEHKDIFRLKGKTIYDRV